MVPRDGDTEAPDTLDDKLVLQFRDGMAALELFFELKAPLLVSDRVSKLALVICAFTDASGLGFGDTFLFDEDI
jgi:hypothetical protein